MTLQRTIERAWRVEGGSCRSAWLRPVSALYRLGRGLHRALYRCGLRQRVALPACVVSIGNLVAGGVGKTPFCRWLALELTQRGLRVLILARGYGRAPGARWNDEGAWLAAELPGVRVVQDRDRARVGAAALREAPADVVLLDDGFQHERLERDVDVVLLDATAPFGNGRLLPAGPLRESPAALRRADFVVATRCEQAPVAVVEALAAQLRIVAPAARFAAVRFPIVAVRHGDTRLPPSALAGREVVRWTAVGSPAAVERTLAALGARVVARQLHADHHRFTTADRAAADALAARFGTLLVITTKDAVKVAELYGGSADCLVLEQGVEVDGAEPLLARIAEQVTARAGRSHRPVSSAAPPSSR